MGSPVIGKARRRGSMIPLTRGKAEVWLLGYSSRRRTRSDAGEYLLCDVRIMRAINSELPILKKYGEGSYSSYTVCSE